MPPHIRQYVINLVVSLPIRRGPADKCFGAGTSCS